MGSETSALFLIKPMVEKQEVKYGTNRYFDFLAADDICIKGHRIGIETVLYEYLYRERTAEEIQQIIHL
jgi:hypothetical protein